MSVEAYIPYDLRERLAEQIKVIDKMMADAVAAERERCAKIAHDHSGYRGGDDRTYDHNHGYQRAAIDILRKIEGREAL